MTNRFGETCSAIVPTPELTKKQKQIADAVCDICMERPANTNVDADDNREAGWNISVSAGDCFESVNVHWCNQCWAEYQAGDEGAVEAFEGIAELIAMVAERWLRTFRIEYAKDLLRDRSVGGVG